MSHGDLELPCRQRHERENNITIFRYS